jgi:hypothetical protein
MGDRRAKEGHETHADVFVDDAAFGFDDGIEAGPEAAEERVGLLNRRRVMQGTEACYPGEEDGELLALPFTTGAQDSKLFLKGSEGSLHYLVAEQGPLRFEGSQCLFDLRDLVQCLIRHSVPLAWLHPAPGRGHRRGGEHLG